MRQLVTKEGASIEESGDGRSGLVLKRVHHGGNGMGFGGMSRLKAGALGDLWETSPNFNTRPITPTPK